MKSFFRLLGLLAVAGIAFVIYRAMQQQSSAAGAPSPAKRSISPDLLAILADPGDKGPVELMSDADGREWLINRRNGFRYPVENGIPIMLLEEGEKHRDPALVTG
jgi:uncharacterized protein YbaR (Trm112 family)